MTAFPTKSAPRIVLVGGGHAHVHVMADLGATRPGNFELVLIAPAVLTPYSGMLPGVVAGHYPTSAAQIDLRSLARATGAKLILDEATGIDRTSRLILLRSGARVPYDLASINVGITPRLDAIGGAAEHAIPVKPVGSFLARIDRLLEAVRRPDGPRRIAVVGAGAAGVELILALDWRMRRGSPGATGIGLMLVTSGDLLPSHNRRVQATFRRLLGEASVSLHEQTPVARIDARGIESEAGVRIAADAVLVATPAAAPAWLAGTGLDVTAGGFLAVRPTLQGTNDDDVFAAGDCADMIETPREKAGVYAVRAGPWLAGNIRRRIEGRELLSWRPQSTHLSLITAGARYAVASKGRLKLEGAWVWTLKRWIDRRWMSQYQRS